MKKTGLAACLDKIGLPQYERAIIGGYQAVAAKTIGVSEWEAAVSAVEKYLVELEAERADIVRQIREAGGVEVAPTPTDESEAEAREDGAEAASKVENFGETLPPARRNMAAKLDESLSDDDIAKRPFSEIWPLAENEAIEDTFAAAVAHAARAEVPAKPRVAYKLKRWVEAVKTVRDLAGMIVSGRTSKEQLADMIVGPKATKRSLRDWWTKVLLLEQTPREQWGRIETVEERPDAISYADGKQVEASHLSVRIDGRSHWLAGDADVEGKARGTVAGNMDGIRKLLADAAPDKRMKFEIRKNKKTGVIFVNKVGDPEYRHLMEFTDAKEARKAINEQYDALVAAWDAVKARDNVTERDLRSAENRPRVGKDHRNGKDVTVEQLQERFGFRGGEFGQWVQQGKGDKERQAILNSAYDALMDLSDILNIPPRAISLNGTLGIAFGSRGSGWASAHFEPSNLVINLTKTRGAGALGHEWFHALDNYFSRLRRDGQGTKFDGGKRKYRDENFITHRPEALMVRKDRSRYFQPMTKSALEAMHERRKHQTDNYAPEKWERDPSAPVQVRPEVEARFAALVEALNDSPMTLRSKALDKGGSGYWASTLERAARAFENYLQARMQEQGYHNDFLANVVPVDDPSYKRSPERYPYLMAGEVKPIAEAFDALFAEVKTRETDAGNVAMFSRKDTSPFDPKEASAVRARTEANINEAKAEFSRRIGRKTAERLFAKGEAGQPGGLVFVHTFADAVERYAAINDLAMDSRYIAALRSGGADTVGFHDPRSGIAFVIAGAKSPNNMAATALHEVGVHAWSSMVPQEQKSELIERAADLVLYGTDAVSQSARNRMVRVGEISKNGTLDRREEAWGYLAEEAERARQRGVSLTDQVSAWVSELVSAVRLALFRAGILVRTSDLTAADLAAAARRNVRDVARLDVATEDAAPAESRSRITESRDTDQADAPIWYSALSRAIDGINAKAMTPEDWIVRIRALAGKQDVKADEIEWSGVVDWLEMLASQPPAEAMVNGPTLTVAEVLDRAREIRRRSADRGATVNAGRLHANTSTQRVTKDEILSFLNANGVKVEEVTLGAPPPASKAGLAKRKAVFDEYAPRINTLHARAGDFRLTPEERQAARDEAEHLMDERDRAADAAYRLPADETLDAKFSTYQLPGGTNYREVLLTLPGKEPIRYEISKAKSGDYVLMERGTKKVLGNFGDDYMAASREMGRLEEEVRRVGATQDKFRSSHWDQPNVVSHIRLNDRVDADGKRVLFVEEIQSDWAQNGRKEGFVATDGEARAIKAEWEAASAAMSKAVDSGSPADRAEAAERLGRASDAYNARINDAKIPRAPFVDTTDKWLTLALKRVLRMAAEEGYDKVAFINGEQSAERYRKALTDAADEITVEKWRDGFKINVFKGGSPIEAATNLGATDAELNDQIGKDMGDEARRRLDAGEEKVSFKSDRGDFKVGGHGFRAFYDKIVPTVLKDVLKKVGGGRASTVDLGNFRLSAFTGEKTDQFDVEHSDQPAITITPQMREKVMSGLPLFSRQPGDDPIESRVRESLRVAHDAVSDVFSSGRAIGLWGRTIGTQLGKARRNPEFGKVFERAQKFIDDIARFALKAEALAPTILPRIGGLRDVPDAIMHAVGQRGMSVADNAWLANALAEGTLAGETPSPLDGRVWTDDDLRTRFSATDDQIALYREARAAIDSSLDTTAMATMVSILRASGLDQRPLDRFESSASTPQLLRSQAISAITAAARKAGASKNDVAVIDRLDARLRTVEEHARSLQAAGYAPLMRFGRLYLTAYRGDEVAHFSRHESRSALERQKRELLAEDPGLRMETGELSMRSYELYEDADLGVIMAFAKEAGIADAAMQKWYELATADRSALKRLIHRKGTAGYSLDARRGLAAFLTSNARFASNAINAQPMRDAAASITNGGVQDEAMALIDYVRKPQEEAAKIRGMLFAWYLGGSIASGLVNMTQPVMMTFPYLSRFGMRAAASAMADGMSAAAAQMRGKEIKDAQLRAAMKKAAESGLTEPSEVHNLMATSRGEFRSPLMQAVHTVWGANFAVTEAWNRKLTFAASFIAARNAGVKDPYAFAQSTVRDTQGVYSRANRPNWARGAIGSTLFSFKQYSIAYLEFLQQLARDGTMPKRQVGLALGMLVLAAGMQGLPGADDLDDLIDAVGQWLGYATNVRQSKRQVLEAAFGETLAAIAMYGISTQLGLDFAARLGLGNLIPGTGALIPSAPNKSRDAFEVAGPFGSLIKDTTTALERVFRGNTYGAVETVVPLAVRNAMKGSTMLVTGEAKDESGRRISDATPFESATKTIGFNPQRQATEGRRIREIRYDEAIVNAKSAEIREQWARAIVREDRAAIDDAIAELREWNEQNPDMQIRIRGADVFRRAADMRRSRQERFIRSIPSSLRERAAEELAEENEQ